MFSNYKIERVPLKKEDNNKGVHFENEYNDDINSIRGSIKSGTGSKLKEQKLGVVMELPSMEEKFMPDLAEIQKDEAPTPYLKKEQDINKSIKKVQKKIQSYAVAPKLSFELPKLPEITKDG